MHFEQKDVTLNCTKLRIGEVLGCYTCSIPNEQFKSKQYSSISAVQLGDPFFWPSAICSDAKDHPINSYFD